MKILDFVCVHHVLRISVSKFLSVDFDCFAFAVNSGGLPVSIISNHMVLTRE